MKWHYIAAIILFVIGGFLLATTDGATANEPIDCTQIVKDTTFRCAVPTDLPEPKPPLCFGEGCPNTPKPQHAPVEEPPPAHILDELRDNNAPAVPNTGA